MLVDGNDDDDDDDDDDEDDDGNGDDGDDDEGDDIAGFLLVGGGVLPMLLSRNTEGTTSIIHARGGDEGRVRIASFA